VDSTIIVALIVGGLSLTGTILSAKFISNVELVKLRSELESLKEKVMKHNNLIDRTYKLESKVSFLEHCVEGK